MGAKSTKEIAEWVCKTGYDSFELSSDEMKYIKSLALKYFGMALVGATMPFGQLVIQHVRNYRGGPESGVIGAGFQTSLEHAALVNGATSHSTELEDNSFPDAMYSCAAWPTVFAVGEKLELSGKEVLEAFIVGWEVASRLGVVAQKAVAKGWAIYSCLWNIGTAVMTAKMLKLDEAQTAMAISIAASQAAGIARQTGSGAHLIEAGFAGRNGICSAMLAKIGYTGNPTILEGRSGYMDLLTDEPSFDLPLGDGWRVMEIGIKKYPCCWLQHRGIDGVIDLISENNISWDDVEYVEHAINNTASLYLKYPDPKTGEDARFSLEHSTVACFLDNEVFLNSFTDKKASDPRFREARKKVKVTVHPEFKPGFFFDFPVTIKLNNGIEYNKVVTKIRGDADNKLSPDDVMKIYLDCINLSGLITLAKARQVADMVLSLDELSNVTKIMNIVTYTDSK